jgi:hypothetical protein
MTSDQITTAMADMLIVFRGIAQEFHRDLLPQSTEDGA